MSGGTEAFAEVTPHMLPLVCRDPAAYEKRIRVPEPGLSRLDILRW